MPRSKKEVGEEFLQGVLALVPEDKRDSIKETLTGIDVEQLGGPIVEAETKAEEAIAKAAKDGELVGKYKQNLDKWYGEMLPQLKKGEEAAAELERLKASPPDPDNPDPTTQTPAPPPGLTKDEVSKQLADALAASERGAVGAIAYFNRLGMEHFQRFNEVLDVANLLKEAEAAGMPVPQFYEQKFAGKFAELDEKAAKEKEDQIRKDEREKVEKELRSREGHRAYPLPGTEPETPTTLVGLKGGDGKDAGSDYGVKAAIDEFYAKGQNYGS
jgi:hypothetical protein